MADKVWVGSIHAETTDHLPVSVIEAKSFYEDALQILTEEDLVDLKMKIAANPKCGSLIPHTGGMRKLRYRTDGREKRGQILYLYHSPALPIFLLAFFTADEEIDPTEGEKAQMRLDVKQLVTAHMRQNLRVVAGRR